jgi:hypothetical protein
MNWLIVFERYVKIPLLPSIWICPLSGKPIVESTSITEEPDATKTVFCVLGCAEKSPSTVPPESSISLL